VQCAIRTHWLLTRSWRCLRSPLLAIAAHESPAYQEALRVLGNAVDRDLRIVPGA